MEDQEESRPSKKLRASSPPTVSSDGLAAFALRLAKKLAEGEGNFAFSPLSIYTTLGLVAAGARGKTLDELLALLGATSVDEIADFGGGLAADPSGLGGPLVTFVYGVFHHERMSLTPSYRRAAAESYKAEIRAVDFAKGDRKEIREEINSWVAAATNNLISEILPEGSLSVGSRFVLTNAIYFKGEWESLFPEELTENLDFHRLGNAAAVQVPFMTFYKGKYDLFLSWHEDFEVLKLPYKTVDTSAAAEAQYSMCIFLPNERDGLPTMVDALAETGDSLLDYLPEHEITVDRLLLPKFKLSFSCGLSGALKDLGLVEAFGEEADLSGMVEKSACDVRLDEVFHKAVIEVNEEGTEAAACAAFTGKTKMCARSRGPEFVADHPFAFYIVEEVSGAVVFAGHVLDPSISE